VAAPALLEIGASAGLNLNADRYRYVVVGGAALGDPACEPAFAPGRSRSPGSRSNPAPTALSCAVGRHRSETRDCWRIGGYHGPPVHWSAELA
jgi:hypothetical protein